MIIESIQSPLDLKSKAHFKEDISVDFIVNGYKRELNIDVSNYFNDIDRVQIYECERTKYKFFYPFFLDGDGNFYEKLQKFEWYYMPWKWEHKTTLNLLKGNEKILEVGSGEFGFVEKMQQEGFMVSGLELNQASIIQAKKKGLNVLNETIQEHAKINSNTYDVVASYQVLEHINEVHYFIKAQVDCLKKGGMLIVSVPNNNSFLRLMKGLLLNMPPHHMGLWNKASLTSLEKLYSIKLSKILYEPLQDYHIKSYIDVVVKNRVNKYLVSRVIYRVFKLNRIVSFFVKKNASKIKGHTMMAIYEKV